MKFQSVMVPKKEGIQYHTATDWINIGGWLEPPPSFINKVEPQQTGKNNYALMGGSSTEAAQRRYRVLIDNV